MKTTLPLRTLLTLAIFSLCATDGFADRNKQKGGKDEHKTNGETVNRDGKTIQSEDSSAGDQSISFDHAELAEDKGGAPAYTKLPVGGKQGETTSPSGTLPLAKPGQQSDLKSLSEKLKMKKAEQSSEEPTADGNEATSESDRKLLGSFKTFIGAIPGVRLTSIGTPPPLVLKTSVRPGTLWVPLLG